MKRFYFFAIAALLFIPGFLMAQTGLQNNSSRPPMSNQQQNGNQQQTGTQQQAGGKQAGTAAAPAAQPDSVKKDYRTDKQRKLKPKKKLKIANALAEKGSYFNALIYYEEVYAKQKDNVHALCQLAKLNYLVRDYQSAEKYFQAMYKLDTAKYIRAQYFWALMEKYDGNCGDANNNFKTFIKNFKNADKDENMDVLKKLIDTQIKGCELAKTALAKPAKVLLDHLDSTVNSKFSNFAPHSYGKDQVIYSSLRSDTAVSVAASDTTGQKAKEYIATKSGDKWINAQLFPAATNSIEYHTGNGCMSPDGKRFYFTNCKPSSRLKMECEIYKNEFSNGQWGTPSKLGPSINDGTDNTEPNVAMLDGKEVLFFVSDRKGGEGGMDIWWAESDSKGDFKNPHNAGKMINTRYNEVTPFFDGKKNVLYFSSDGRVSIGGFDIYSSTRLQNDTLKAKKGDFTEPKNMLAPYNSSVDDIYFTPDSSGKQGYLVSNRAGGYSIKAPTCADNIYHFKIINDIILKGYAASKYDPKTPLDSADITIFIKENGMNVPIASLTTRKAEEFMVTLDPEKEYQVNVTKNGYWGSETPITKDTLSKVKDTLNMVFLLDTIARRKIQLKRIYYQFDKYNITRDYKKTLDSLADILKDNPTWTAELYGFTDSVGTEEYNMVLGKERAQSAADYLVLKGIDINRLSLIAKGKADYQAPNSTPNGKDNPVGRAKNRRVEYKLNSNDKKKPVEVEYNNDHGPY